MAGIASVGGQALVPASGSGAGAVPLGVYVGAADPPGVAAFGKATHTAPTYAADYLPWQSGWGAMTQATSLSWLLGPWSSSSYQLVLGVPMIPESSSGTAQGTLAGGAAGDYDSYFATLAQTLIAGGEADAVLRIGWEFNGSWYPWEVTNSADAANFVTYFDRIVTVMRSVPGEAFKFVWNPNNLGSFDSSYGPDQTYPGDAYVDYVGTDVYDQCWCTPQTPQGAWASQLQGTWGLDWLASFASAHGKQMAFPEWGLAIRSDGHGLGDDGYFVTQFAAWIAAQANVAFTCYFAFDSPGQSDDILDGHFPDALTAFTAAFGQSGSPPTSTTSPGSPGTTTSTTSPPTTTVPVTVPPTTVPPTTMPPTTVPPTTTMPVTSPTTTVPVTSPPTTAPPTPPTTTTPSPPTSTTIPPTTVPPTTSTTTSGSPPTSPPTTPTTGAVPSSISFNVSPDATDPGQLLTWSVTPPPAEGSLSFSIDGWEGQLAVPPDGVVTLALFLTDGTHDVEAWYSGDTTLAPSSLSESFQAGRPLSVLTVAPPAAVGPDNTFELQATLTAGGFAVPDRLVTFYAAGVALCSGATDDAGVATCVVTEGEDDADGLATGGVRAAFAGDADVTPAVSASPISESVLADDITHVGWSSSAGSLGDDDGVLEAHDVMIGRQLASVTTRSSHDAGSRSGPDHVMAGGVATPGSGPHRWPPSIGRAPRWWAAGTALGAGQQHAIDEVDAVTPAPVPAPGRSAPIDLTWAIALALGGFLLGAGSLTRLHLGRSRRP